MENTLPRIQCQICTTIRRIPEYTSEDETHINNERGPRIQYQACTAISSNDSSDPRIHFTEKTFKHTSMLSSQNTEPRDHRRNPSITHPLRTCKLFSGSKIQLERFLYLSLNVVVFVFVFVFCIF